MRCYKCNILFFTIAEFLQDSIFFLYSACYQVNDCRFIQNKQALSLDRLQFDILLYEKESLNQNTIEYICANNIRVRIDTILIVETKIKISETKRLAIELYQLIKTLSTERATI